ncbi:MAG: hypothetical protein AAGK01_01895 [Pseudomonadota bacterium]
MDYLQVLFFAVYAATLSVGVYILVAKPKNGNAIAAAMVCALFAGYTGVQIWSEGVVMFLTNHSANMTGIQVWWDLVMSVLIAFFFILPRARAAGMNVIPWAILVSATASIGLLAMCARLFWLENQSEAAPAAAKPAEA